jgi:serine protease AprX
MPGARVSETLGIQLQSAQADEMFDVVVGFRLPLEQIDVPLLEIQLGAFSPVVSIPLVRAVGLRLTRDQVLAMARLEIVAQIEPDVEMHAYRTSAMKWFGITAARADYGLTGDGDGDPDVFTSADHTIAILDTGIDATHVELDGGKVIAWKDFVNNRVSPYDDGMHGTHVASTAAGKQIGGQGGVAPGAALVGVKVLNSAGSGPESRVMQGINWCVQNRETYGIRVLNLSLGTPGTSDGNDMVSQTVDAAVAAGLTVVCAAGNSGPVVQTVGSPAAARSAIAVGAAADPDVGGVYAPSWSSRGATRDGRVKPDLLAPGVSITAARANSVTGYVTYSGTSMAAPFVTGVIALMLEQSPQLTPVEIAAALTRTARHYGPSGPNNEYGNGLLDAYMALQTATAATINPPPFPRHESVSGRISPETPSVTHTFSVASTRYPIAVTLIIPNWSTLGTTHLDAELIDPDGQRLLSALQSTRQQTLVVSRPQKAGTYTLRVFAHSDRVSAAYFFDVSADLQDTRSGD